MNKRGHVLNAIVLSVGLACLAHPSLDAATVRAAVAIGVPVTLGALIPDVDTAFGTHRKTLHNLPVLLLFFVYPHYFGNLQFVWIGVATHYVLDLFGSKRGLALLYPLDRAEFDVPVGVSARSRYAGGLMVLITAFELVVAAALAYDLPRRLVASGLRASGLA
ncbi:membrane-bound metal-dependent hydrolase [Halococcus morrhuae DSM 1307]|uniref:Membrane-bound metal-dependent hydrolase n=1 Tax=Halococcus morrhuae DSM 1307 TaxID=931277 RepID=M0MIS9_HALMO|nr:metal-dependent hydrolase [Halococcus morrhuae]EMA45602.1 membrane-bound metal-dependent hydrolase [Halococcus morrhuae DSM 1307]